MEQFCILTVVVTRIYTCDKNSTELYIHTPKRVNTELVKLEQALWIVPMSVSWL